MRFTHPNQITYPSPEFMPSVPAQPGQSLIFTKDASGNTVVVSDAHAMSPEAYNQDLSELRARLDSHNWYYHLQNDSITYANGYHNEQAILQIVRRRGGIFKTIWETERGRRLTAAY